MWSTPFFREVWSLVQSEVPVSIQNTRTIARPYRERLGHFHRENFWRISICTDLCSNIMCRLSVSWGFFSASNSYSTSNTAISKSTRFFLESGFSLLYFQFCDTLCISFTCYTNNLQFWLIRNLKKALYGVLFFVLFFWKGGGEVCELLWLNVLNCHIPTGDKWIFNV